MFLLSLKEEGERDQNIDVRRNINRLSPVRSLTGDRTSNLQMCPDWGLNPQPFGVQDNAPTELPTHPPGLMCVCVF